ncbi:MAG: DNA-formamidopyrimidine glycosylase family protein [Actinomycetota bacterium]
MTIYLPEAEIVRRELDRDIVGKKVKDVDVDVAKIVKRSGNRTSFANALTGAKISSLARVGTHFLATLDTEQILVMALSPTTTVRRNANKDKVESDTVVTITFTQQGQLRLLDPKNALEVFLVPADEPVLDTVPELADLGMDPLAKAMAWTDFGREVLSHDTKLKSLLTDNSVIVGLGDIYSDEILFEASLRYDRLASSLNTQEVRRFFRSVVTVLNDAVKYRGTTIDSSPFVDPGGNPGNFQDHLQVYGKHGQLSPRSRQPLVRTKFAGRWTYYCDQSQV